VLISQFSKLIYENALILWIKLKFISHWRKNGRRWPECAITNVDALMPNSSNEKNVNSDVRASSRYQLVVGNIGNFPLMLKTLCENQVSQWSFFLYFSEFLKIVFFLQIDTVINFAANSHVDECYDDSVSTTENNVMGTLKLLEACRMYGALERFVHISTDEVYGR
jgi:dTDP-D-glucose 4,6-dehydratase